MKKVDYLDHSLAKKQEIINIHFKCIRCNYECDISKRMEEHIDRKNKCKDINNSYVNDVALLKRMIIDNTNQRIKIKESNHVENNQSLIETISNETISKNESKNVNYTEHPIKRIKNIFGVSDILTEDNTLVSNLKDLCDCQKRQFNISQNYQLDIIFNYNINLNIKQVSPFKDNPKMKESVEKLVAVVKEENNKLSDELIKKEYNSIMEAQCELNENNIINNIFDIEYEKEINMNVSYNIMYYYCNIDDKGFFYIHDINYEKTKNA